MDWKLELVPIPVADVDLAKSFYVDKVGFNLDFDHKMGDEMRIVQLTPTGSACSILLSVGVIHTEPGSVQNLHIVVSDIEAARAELVERGVEASDIHRFEDGTSYVYFSDPDGNSWAVQMVGGRG